MCQLFRREGVYPLFTSSAWKNRGAAGRAPRSSHASEAAEGDLAPSSFLLGVNFPRLASGASPTMNHPFLLEETQFMSISPPPCPKTSITYQLKRNNIVPGHYECDPVRGTRRRAGAESHPEFSQLPPSSPSLPPTIQATTRAVFICNCGPTTTTTTARRMPAPQVPAIVAAPCHPPSKAPAQEHARQNTLVVSPAHRFTRKMHLL